MTLIEKQLNECLTDAGCAKKEKAKILQCYSEHNIQQMISLLRMHRKVTLDTIHTGERQISCLYYLVF